MKNVKSIHHLLYAFSPDRSPLKLDEHAEANYLYGYPGDDYVDFIGLDDYADVGRKGGPDSPQVQKESLLTSLKMITRIAKEKNKVATFSETGLEGVTQANWFTDIILNPIKANQEDIQIAWVLVWRNANIIHHYAPYPGHSSEADFKLFEQDELTYFGGDLGKKLYKKPKK